jgi:hypothetical protein
LVKLAWPATINARVKTIGLSSATIGSNATVIAAGWGATAVQQPFDPATASATILQRFHDHAHGRDVQRLGSRSDPPPQIRRVLRGFFER